MGRRFLWKGGPSVDCPYSRARPPGAGATLPIFPLPPPLLESWGRATPFTKLLLSRALAASRAGRGCCWVLVLRSWATPSSGAPASRRPPPALRYLSPDLLPGCFNATSRAPHTRCRGGCYLEPGRERCGREGRERVCSACVHNLFKSDSRHLFSFARQPIRAKSRARPAPRAGPLV